VLLDVKLTYKELRDIMVNVAVANIKSTF
jgi:hypothetical protein